VSEDMAYGESWRRSSFCSEAADCVEVAWQSPRFIAVRDSKNTSGARLAFTVDQWKEFTDSVKNGESVKLRLTAS